MKKTIPLLLLSFFIIQTNHSQNPLTTGKAITQIFTDFHYNINDTSETTGFGLNRAWLGYKFMPDDNFSATIIVNIGSPEDLTYEAVHRRYAYFREASIAWTKEKLSLSFGITSTQSYSFQQIFLGKRYIADSFQSLNEYGYNADLGFAVNYTFNDIVKVDFTIMNGEGYSEIQFDNAVKFSAGISITPNKKLALRFYSDITRPHSVLQYTITSFAGYKDEIITIGAEINYKTNLDIVEGHDAWGVSTTAALGITERKELFVRYDYATSVKLPGDILPWNHENDGRLFITGIQHTFSENVKTALNYQGHFPFDNKQATGLIFLNAFFKF